MKHTAFFAFLAVSLSIHGYQIFEMIENFHQSRRQVKDASRQKNLCFFENNFQKFNYIIDFQ
jgi:hypothetical protein